MTPCHRRRARAVSVPAALLLLLAGFSLSRSIAEGFPDFESFQGAYGRADATSRPKLARAFIQEQQARGGFPAIQPDGSVIFFYAGRGDERDVRVVGDFRTRSSNDVYWSDAGEPMSRAVPDGAVFFKRLTLENDARIDYAFRFGGEPGLDPLNPRVGESGMVEKACELVMPGYRPSPAATPRANVPRGGLRVVDEAWATPKVTVYLPAGYDPAKRYPVIYTADGSAWIRIIGLPAILDNLIADRVIEPVIAVLIDPTDDRSRWYDYDPAYLTYLEKVVEYIDGRYSTRARADQRLHIGTSSGGRATLYVGFERPGLFGDLAMLSPSLTGPPHYFEPYFAGSRRPDRSLRIWLSAGTYEEYIHRDTRTLESYFRRVGVKTKAIYTHEGHSFGAWRNLTPDMLEYFFPAHADRGERSAGPEAT